ncbi:hypothetical protein [Sinorhizobium psoraleae]|uniref:Uncharacterized protein n=1 Tax=Sinorhizobium psoraleae TaxID=520838 RepID=A0ABT4KNU4_9HYPH|nr:hypothetical protein [Sinorhizobium psoraleae]MCZ4093450.1 hypothetical protein [Sinorhizobium psoraleae]
MLPSNVRTGAGEQAGAVPGDEQVRLVLKNAAGKEIGRVRPELRFEACDDGETPHRALIQQDIEVISDLAEIDLEFQGKTVDAFRPEQASPVDQQFREAANFGLPLPGRPGKLSLGTPKIQPQRGVSYMVQAKPDNSTSGRPSPSACRRPTSSWTRTSFPAPRHLRFASRRMQAFKAVQSTREKSKLNERAREAVQSHDCRLLLHQLRRILLASLGPESP